MQDLTLRLDMDNELVRDWLDRLLDASTHPMYQNGIQVLHPKGMQAWRHVRGGEEE
jgi:hypothetical protein